MSDPLSKFRKAIVAAVGSTLLASSLASVASAEPNLIPATTQFVKLRPAVEALGGQLSWIPSTKTITISLAGVQTAVTIGSKEFKFGNDTFKLPMAVEQRSDGRTYVPTQLLDALKNPTEAAYLMSAAPQPIALPRIPGPKGDGTGITPNNWNLRPAGTQVQVGDRPMGVALSPDGKSLLVSNNGKGIQSMQVIDTQTQQVVQTIPYKSPEALFLGVVFDPSGNRAYASAGGNNKLRVYQVAGGQLTEQDPIMLGDTKDKIYPAGLAISPDGSTLYSVNNYGNNVSIVDARGGKVLQNVPVGKSPYTAALAHNPNKLYVTNWGEGTVSVIDLQKQAVVSTIRVGDHPNAVALHPQRDLLFVANGNSDTVSVIDTNTDAVVQTLSLAPYPQAPVGSTPNALSISPDGRTLYVANAGNNDVAVVDLQLDGTQPTLTTRGLIPTAWYPAALAVSPDGKQIYVANTKGVGSGPNPGGPVPTLGKQAPNTQYISEMIKGTVSLIATPDQDQLKALTSQVIANNGFDEMSGRLISGSSTATPVAIPRRVGDPSLFKHVIYVIRENRTYDQIFGDLPGGNGDPSITLFDDKTAANARKLAQEFVLFDNLYADAEVSATGHQWSMGAQATDYAEKNWPGNYGGRNRGYDFEGSPLAAPTAGYIWDFAMRAGLSFRDYGEFVQNPSDRTQPVKAALPSMDGHFDPMYRGFDAKVPDRTRVAEWQREFRQFEQSGNLPQFSIVRFANDHTEGTGVGKPTPSAYIADNDTALGQLVETVSNSSYWKDTAIFVIEDDAQNGPDHVDAHRTVGLVISPYTKRHFVDHTFYDTTSMLRTMELTLGIPPMSQFDAWATPMLNAFTDTPDLTPYQSLIPFQSPDQMNTAAAPGAALSATFDFSAEDRAPADQLNRIIWASVKGDVPMPEPHTIFRERNADPAAADKD